MPMHDWTKVNSGLYHHFHQQWISTLTNALNTGRLPEGYYAFQEQVTGRPVPDVLALEMGPEEVEDSRADVAGGVALALAPPKASLMFEAEEEIYARKADRVAIRHGLGRVVAIVEIVSPGNKDRLPALRRFVEKAAEFLDQGVHLLIVDPFPPGKHDPGGMGRAVWEEVQAKGFELPEGKPLSVSAFMAGPILRAYIEPIAVGDALPALPIFLTDEIYVPAPLEETYMTTWGLCPKPLRQRVEA